MARKGKGLEQLMKAIQETIKTDESIRIQTNKQIKNLKGRKREFDVVLEMNVNRINIIIAFECKDYKKAVDIKEVDAFHSKCLNIPSINSKIMVSAKGFTEGAKQEAESFGIQLYTIDEVPISEIIDRYKMTTALISYTVLHYCFTKRNDPCLYFIHPLSQ